MLMPLVANFGGSLWKPCHFQIYANQNSSLLLFFLLMPSLVVFKCDAVIQFSTASGAPADCILSLHILLQTGS